MHSKFNSLVTLCLKFFVNKCYMRSKKLGSRKLLPTSKQVASSITRLERFCFTLHIVYLYNSCANPTNLAYFSIQNLHLKVL